MRSSHWAERGVVGEGDFSILSRSIVRFSHEEGHTGLRPLPPPGTACHSVLQHRIPTFPVGGRSSTLWLRTWTQTAWVRSLAPPLPADLGQGAKASAAASVQWGQGHWQPQEVFSENFRRYILCHEQFVLCPLVLLCLSF